MKQFRLLLCFVCLSPLCGEPDRVIRIATWNVRNYLLQNRWYDGQYRFAYPKPEIEKRALREILLEVRPDILFLQEIGTLDMLSELQEDLSADGLTYPTSCFSVLPDARSGLALLSVIPPREVLLLDPKEDPDVNRPLTQRGVQVVVFEIKGMRLRAFHVHLKSRYTSDKTDPDSRRFRTAELEILAGLLKWEMSVPRPAETQLLLGDFNTPFGSRMLDPLRKDFLPLKITDSSGDEWTYHYEKTEALEQLDGFWTTSEGLAEFSPVGLFPEKVEHLNRLDHRLVVVDWLTGSGSLQLLNNIPD